MNISNKQLLANKKNAKKGGVKSEEGKEITKFNSYNHGLTANRLLDEKESVKYNFILRKLSEELKIEGYLEKILVERIAFYYVKIHKANEIEEKFSYFESLINALDRKSKLIELQKNGENLNPDLIEVVENQADILEINNIDGLLQIQRYTTSIENRLYKATTELLKIKKLKDPDFKMIGVFKMGLFCNFFAK